MEDLLPFNHKEISFVRIFFRILIAFFLVILILLFVVPINDSISFSEGEIIAKNPEVDYKAPFEVTLEKNFVKEGDIVKKGDTLVIIKSSQLNKELSSSFNEKNSLFNQLNSEEKKFQNINNKISLAYNEINLKTNEYDIRKEKAIGKLSSLNKSILLLKEKLSVKFKKLKMDSLMFQKDVISLITLRNSYDEYLSYKQDVIEAEKEKNELQVQLKDLENIYSQQVNEIRVNIASLNERKEDIVRNQVRLEGNLKVENEELKYYTSELNKQYITSDIDGVITKVFNEKKDINFISKGESLVSVSPIEKSFYVKIRINERDIKYVKVEQSVNLKLDAFYYYEYGALKGFIDYIPERKRENNYFDVIVNIPQETKFSLKSGYSTRGEVIIEKMPIIKYSLKKIFRKIEDNTRKSA